MGILKRREEFDYFGGFIKCAGSASEAAVYLCSAFEQFNPDKIGEHVRNMHRIENDADLKKHEMTHNLAKEFITPIEREDISALADELDNIIDAVEDVMQRIYMLNVKKLRSEAVEFARLTVRCCDSVEKLTVEFRNFKKSSTIRQAIIDVNSLESRGDELYSEAVRRLFTTKTDTEERMVWMVIFEALERCLDACEHAADIIESVIMKNS